MKPALSICALLLAAFPAAVLAQAPGPSGSYSIKICRGQCDAKSGKPFLTGTLTLLPSPLRDRDGKPFGDSWATGINGCFSLKRLREQRDSHAGTRLQGYLSWSYTLSDSAVTFALYRSPSALYEVQLKPSGNGFAGIGISLGKNTAKGSAPRDTVIAVRRATSEPPKCPPPPG